MFSQRNNPYYRRKKHLTRKKNGNNYETDFRIGFGEDSL